MVRRTQAVRRQQPTNSLSVLDHFVGFALKGFKVKFATNLEFSFKENSILNQFDSQSTDSLSIQI